MEENVNSTTQYKAYAERLKKVNILKIVMALLSATFVIMLIFMPIFEGESLEGARSFSLYDEFQSLLNGINKANGSKDAYFFYIFILFPAVTLVYGLISVVLSVKKLISNILNFNKFDDYALLEYNSIKKTGSTIDNQKKSFLKAQTIYSFLFLGAFSIVFPKIMGPVFADAMSGFGELILIEYSPMYTLKSVSPVIIVLVIALIAYIVLNVIEKNIVKSITVEISKE